MFKIGEFSKLAQVSVHLLRHYDEIGLLAAARVDRDTNYRYYVASQLPRLNKILALRDMGLSLDQVRDVIEEEASPDEIRNMFALKRAQLERSITEDVALLRSIEARLERIDEGDRAIDYDITVKALPAMTILGFRREFADFGVAAMALGEMHSTADRAGLSSRLGDVVAVMHNDGIGESGHDVEMGFIAPDWTERDEAPRLPDGTALEARVLPEVPRAATAVRAGLPSTSHVCRADLALWIERNHYELAGTGREVFLVPPAPGREDQTVIEIQLPIQAAPTAPT